MKRLVEADIRLETVGETKAGIKLVIIVQIVARLETTLEPGLILYIELLCEGSIS